MPQEFLRNMRNGEPLHNSRALLEKDLAEQKLSKQRTRRLSHLKLLEAEPQQMPSIERVLLEEQIQLGVYPNFEYTKMQAAKFTFLDRIRISLRRLMLLLSEILGSRRKLSKRAQQALLQLNYLANLLQTSVSLSEDEAIELQAAFGRAYYNILYPAAKPKDEKEFYESQFSSLLAAMV
jgi:hypothetical protein